LKRAAFILALAAAGALAQLPGRAHAEAQVVAAPDGALTLQAGGGRLVRLSRAAATVFVADPKIADIQVKSPTLVYVMGKAPGATNLFAVDGREQMIANLAIDVSLDATGLQAAIKRQIPDSEVQVSTDGPALVLSGKVRSATEGVDVIHVATAFLGGADKESSAHLVNRLMIDAPDQINLRVQIAEVSRDATKTLGVDWNALGQTGSTVLGLVTGNDIVDSVTGKLIRPPGQVGALAAGVRTPRANITSVLEALEEKQLVTMLAEPNLTAVSGEPASFLAGGEYPIPVPQGLNQVTIEYKSYGVRLAFVATILDSGRISLEVNPEVSQLTTNGSITLNSITVPALTTRRAETTVELASGESFAIGGLLQNNLSQDLKKFPGLADTPILGELFRSKRFERNESELVIIVTPYLVRASPHRLALPTDHPAQTPQTTASTTPAPATSAAPSKKAGA
jgi:pilus assembly protein CpaC